MTPHQFARHVEQVAEQLAHDVDQLSWASDPAAFTQLFGALEHLRAKAQLQAIELEHEQ